MIFWFLLAAMMSPRFFARFALFFVRGHGPHAVLLSSSLNVSFDARSGTVHPLDHDSGFHLHVNRKCAGSNPVLRSQIIPTASSPCFLVDALACTRTKMANTS